MEAANTAVSPAEAGAHVYRNLSRTRDTPACAGTMGAIPKRVQGDQEEGVRIGSRAGLAHPRPQIGRTPRQANGMA